MVIPYTANAITNTDPSDIMAMRYSQCILIDDKSVGGKGNTKVGAYCSTKKVIGGTHNDYSTTCAISTVPSLQWYWLVIFDASESETEATITFDVKIVYYTKLLSRCTNRNES